MWNWDKNNWFTTFKDILIKRHVYNIWNTQIINLTIKYLNIFKVDKYRGKHKKTPFFVKVLVWMPLNVSCNDILVCRMLQGMILCRRWEELSPGLWFTPGPTFKERHCINGIPRYIYAVSPPGEALTDLRFVFYPPTPPNSSEMLFSPVIPEVKTFADRKESCFSRPE